MELTRKGNKILLVDDEPDITMTFKAILQEVGFIVDTYEDPLIALSKFTMQSTSFTMIWLFWISKWPK